MAVQAKNFSLLIERIDEPAVAIATPEDIASDPSGWNDSFMVSPKLKTSDSQSLQ